VPPVHERLKQARIAAGYATPTEAARAFGWAVSTYLGHENGDRNPSKVAAKRYANAFRTTAGYLLYGEQTPISGQPAASGGLQLDPVRVAHVISALLRMFRRDISQEDADQWAKAALVRAEQPEDPAAEPVGHLRTQLQAQFGAQKLENS
jgi:transcriptional regulator with XRE-family HTH domain